MRKVAFLVIAALCLMAVSAGGSYAQIAKPVTVLLMEQNGSGESGTATLSDMGNGMTHVVVTMTNAPDVAQPIHIHKGTCANLDPVPAYPLTNVTAGQSDTMVPVSLDTLTPGTYAINVHKSAAEASVYVACGDIGASPMAGGGTGTTGGETTTAPPSGTIATPGMPSTGAPDQNFLVLALILFALSISGVGLRLARRKA
jgi:Cu/Zn superoxide dismutase